MALAFVVAALLGLVPGFAAAQPIEQARLATGTAFVVHPDGVLLTADHVIDQAISIRVLIRGRHYDALVQARNKRLDLAVLRVGATKLPALQVGESKTVRLGEDVRAFGFPLKDILGRNVKVTRGTVSGTVSLRKRLLFQIDAPVNPGNSGGPLVNQRGEVIGVVHAKLVDFEVSNVAFAIPINYAKRLLRDAAVSLPPKQNLPRRDGPDLVESVAPSVVLVITELRP